MITRKLKETRAGFFHPKTDEYWTTSQQFTKIYKFLGIPVYKNTVDFISDFGELNKKRVGFEGAKR